MSPVDCGSRLGGRGWRGFLFESDPSQQRNKTECAVIEAQLMLNGLNSN